MLELGFDVDLELLQLPIDPVLIVQIMILLIVVELLRLQLLRPFNVIKGRQLGHRLDHVWLGVVKFLPSSFDGGFLELLDG